MKRVRLAQEVCVRTVLLSLLSRTGLTQMQLHLMRNYDFRKTLYRCTYRCWLVILCDFLYFGLFVIRHSLCLAFFSLALSFSLFLRFFLCVSLFRCRYAHRALLIKISFKYLHLVIVLIFVYTQERKKKASTVLDFTLT